MSKKSNSSPAREARKKKAKERKRSALTDQILAQLGDAPIEVDTFSSDRWESLRAGPEGKYWEAAKGIVLGLVKGNDTELRQPVYPDMSPEEFIEKMKSLVTDPDMYEFEMNFATKFGPFRSLPFIEWYTKVTDLWMTTSWNPDEKALELAKYQVVQVLKDTLQRMGLETIPALNVEEALEKVTKGRNSGFPFCSSKWHKDPEMLDYYVTKAEMLIQGVDTLKGTPHILFKRVQPNGNTPKMRAVECPPKHDSIAAKCLTDGFVKVFKETQIFSGFNGGENVYKHIAPLMKHDILVESDFSGFDQRCQEIMPHVFEVVSQLVPKRFYPYLRIVLEYYQHAELLTPIGFVRGKGDKVNGLCSGDGWTSVIGTLANAIAVKYTMIRMGESDYDHLAFGDDIAIGCANFDVREFEKYMSELGMDCNRTKQRVTSGANANFSFLGYYHFRQSWLYDGNRGKFPICRLAPGLFYREFVANPTSLENEGVEGEELEAIKADPKLIDMVAIVTKLQNAKDHDDFEALVEFIREGSPHKLDTEKIIDVEKLREHIRNGRKTRSSSFVNSLVIAYLRHLEGRPPILDLTQVEADVQQTE